MKSSMAQVGTTGFDSKDMRPFGAPKQPIAPKKVQGSALSEAMNRLQEAQVPANMEHAAPSVVGDLVAGEAAPVWLEASRMRVWEHNPRHVIDPEKLDQLGKSIEEFGQSEPVDVVEDPDEPGHYLILGGQRRWLVISRRNLQEGKVLARIRPGLPSKEAMFAAAIETQVNTDPLSDIDFAISLALSKDDIGVRALSRVINKSPGEISKLRQVGELPPALLAYVKDHAKKFSLPFAYELVGINESVGEIQAIEFAKVIVLRNLTHKAVLVQKEGLLSDRAPKKRSAWSTLRLSVAGREAGSIRMKESTGELALKLRGLSPEGMEIMREAITRATANATAAPGDAAS